MDAASTALWPFCPEAGTYEWDGNNDSNDDPDWFACYPYAWMP